MAEPKPMSPERAKDLADECFYIPRDGTTTRIARPEKLNQLECIREIERCWEEHKRLQEQNDAIAKEWGAWRKELEEENARLKADLEKSKAACGRAWDHIAKG